MTTDEARNEHEGDYVTAREPANEPPTERVEATDPSPSDAHSAAAVHESVHAYERQQRAAATLPEKVPMTASLLSIVPGLGNIYNGLYGRGIAFFLIQFGLLRVAVATQRDEDLALLFPSMIFFWLFNIFDAYRQAILINIGGDRARLAMRRSEAGGLLFPGLVLVGIGTVGALNRYLEVDIWQLFDHWPALILIVGVVLVVRGVAAKAKSRHD